jgi:hypothetical protein
MQKNNDVVKLALAVKGGDFLACGPLLDALAEADDPRYGRLSELLGQATSDAQAVEARFAIRNSRRSPEEHAFRRDQACFELWMNFLGVFERTFWAELSGVSVLERIADAAAIINAPKQAQRAQRVSEDSPEAEDSVSEGMVMGAGPIRNYGGRYA